MPVGILDAIRFMLLLFFMNLHVIEHFESITSAHMKQMKQNKLLALFQVSWRVYYLYIKSLGLCGSAATLLMVIAASGLRMYSNIWLSQWSDHSISNAVNTTSDRDNDGQTFYLIVYSLIGLVQSK